MSILLLAPLFMHFALVFPERSPGWIRNRLGSRLFPLVYAPALVLGVAQAVAVVGSDASPLFAGAVERVWELLGGSRVGLELFLCGSWLRGVYG